MGDTLQTPQGVLGFDLLRDRIAGGEIFVSGSWEEANLRPASYDVRIARDLMRVPHAVYKQGQYCFSSVILNPGDVAFVTSEERFRVPWDIAGNIGVRFGFAGKGILVHTGLLIHPGFGMESPAGERLHFILANLSPDPAVFRPFDKVASIQFFPVSGGTSHEATGGNADLVDKYIVKGEPLGLAYLGQLSALEGRINHAEAELRRVDQASESVILFGAYVVAAAFLGVVFAQVLAFLSDEKRAQVIGHSFNELDLGWPDVIAMLLVVLVGLTFINLALPALGQAIVRSLAEVVAVPRRMMETITRWSATHHK